MVRLTDRPDMTLDVYRGRKTTIQQQQQSSVFGKEAVGWRGRILKQGVKINIVCCINTDMPFQSDMAMFS